MLVINTLSAKSKSEGTPTKAWYTQYVHIKALPCNPVLFPEYTCVRDLLDNAAASRLGESVSGTVRAENEN